MARSRRLLKTLRNTEREKLDLIVNDEDGFLVFRLWITRDDGATAKIKEIGITEEELRLALSAITFDKEALHGA